MIRRVVRPRDARIPDQSNKLAKTGAKTGSRVNSFYRTWATRPPWPPSVTLLRDALHSKDRIITAKHTNLADMIDLSYL